MEDKNTQEKFKELIIYLDCFLTNHSYRECEHTFKNQSNFYNLIYGDAYYLSDGGYSRLCWDFINNKGIFLTSESRDEVRSRFRQCPELISDLNDFLYPTSDELL